MKIMSLNNFVYNINATAKHCDFGVNNGFMRRSGMARFYAQVHPIHIKSINLTV